MDRYEQDQQEHSKEPDGMSSGSVRAGQQTQAERHQDNEDNSLKNAVQGGSDNMIRGG